MCKCISVLYCILLLATSASAQDYPKKTSLSLKDAIEIAVKNHPEINKSKQGIEAAKGRYYKDISLPRPEISLVKEFIPFGLGSNDNYDKSLEISQSFDFPTVYMSRGSRANVEIEVAKSEHKLVENKVRLSVKMAYYVALTKSRIMAIAEENLAIATEFNKKAEIRYNVGEGSNLEFLTSKIQLTEAKTLIGSANKEYLTALNELEYSIGYSPGIDFKNITFSDSLNYRKFEISRDALVEKSMQANPQIRKISAQLESSDISKTIANMSYLPSFNAAYMSQSTNNSTGFFGFKLGLSVPLWFMFDQKGQVQEADANYQLFANEAQSVKNKIKASIITSYIDYINDEKQVNLYKDELIPQADEIFRSANLSYQAGEITYLEYLQAKFTVINTRMNYTKSLFEYNEAIINIEESTGIELE